MRWVTSAPVVPPGSQLLPAPSAALLPHHALVPEAGHEGLLPLGCRCRLPSSHLLIRGSLLGCREGAEQGHPGQEAGPHLAGSAHPRPDLEAVSRPCEAGPLSPEAVSPHPLVPALG